MSEQIEFIEEVEPEPVTEDDIRRWAELTERANMDVAWEGDFTEMALNAMPRLINEAHRLQAVIASLKFPAETCAQTSLSDDDAIAQYQSLVAAATSETLDELISMVRQNCYEREIDGVYVYSHSFMSAHESAIGYLVDKGIMRHTGNERYVFVEDERQATIAATIDKSRNAAILPMPE